MNTLKHLKKAVVLAVCAAVLGSSAPVRGPVQASGRLIRGDVNLDGKVNQLDASLIMRELLYNESSGESVLSSCTGNYVTESNVDKIINYVADVDMSDGGNAFTLTDATLILRAVLAADIAGEEEISDDIWKEVTGVDYSRAAVLWCGDTFKYEDNVIFSTLSDDTDIADITFKVKDDVPDGVYELKYLSNYVYSSAICDRNANGLNPAVYSGIVGVNREVQDDIYGDEFSFTVGNASVKQGDIFTVTCSLKNIKEEIAGLNFYIAYDRNIFEVISVSPSEDIKGHGDFVCSKK